MRFFTSDTHFGHANIIRYCDRPFWKPYLHPATPDVELMNETLIANWNDTVSPNDEVWFLGDWCMGDERDGLAIRERLNGEITFIPGNHDKCWKGNKKGSEKWEQHYSDAGFLILHGPPLKLALRDGPVVNLNHFPYTEHDNRRFEEWRIPDRGEWLLHGHVHDKWKINGRQINVGVDVWNFKPVSEDEIVRIISDR